MLIIEQSAAALKRFLAQPALKPHAQRMVLRLVLAFIMHRGRMSCSAAAGAVASQAVHRGEVTRFLAGRRWQKTPYNPVLRQALLALEARRGRFVFILDATLFSQAGVKTENTYSTGNRPRRPRPGRRYQHRKITRKTVHSFTFGLLITPSGMRLPFQLPHYTKEYCQSHGLKHRTTAQAAAELIGLLPLPDGADVVVLGDTAYDAHVVRQACAKRGYRWIVPANAARVFEGPRGQRPLIRSCLEHWSQWSLTTFKLHMSSGPFAVYRRLSQWRVGLKQKPRVFYAYQEKREVRSVGWVRLVFSTMKPKLVKATAQEVKILMTNAMDLDVREILELYSLRWQIELLFKELKSTLHLGQYRFQKFQAVEAWMEIALTTVLFLEYERAQRLGDKRLSAERRAWWARQRLHGLCAGYRQQCQAKELKSMAQRLKTPGGVKKLQRELQQATPAEYRVAA